MREIKRSSDRRFCLAEITALGESMGQKTQIEWHPCQVIYGSEVRYSSFELGNPIGRAVTLRQGNGSSIQSGNRAAGEHTVLHDVLVEHLDITRTLVIAP